MERNQRKFMSSPLSPSLYPIFESVGDLVSDPDSEDGGLLLRDRESNNNAVPVTTPDNKTRTAVNGLQEMCSTHIPPLALEDDVPVVEFPMEAVRATSTSLQRKIVDTGILVDCKSQAPRKSTTPNWYSAISSPRTSLIINSGEKPSSPEDILLEKTLSIPICPVVLTEKLSGCIQNASIGSDAAGDPKKPKRQPCRIPRYIGNQFHKGPYWKIPERYSK